MVQIKLIALPFTACAQTPSSDIKIIRADEPGIPFSYVIQVLDQVTQKPIAGAQVFIYQTNSVGDYESAKPEDARIAGTLITDASGKGYVATIFPRGYNNSATGQLLQARVSRPIAGEMEKNPSAKSTKSMKRIMANQPIEPF